MHSPLADYVLDLAARQGLREPTFVRAAAGGPGYLVDAATGQRWTLGLQPETPAPDSPDSPAPPLD